jgi:hypothetical protein
MGRTTIWTHGNYRITEKLDIYFDMENLKGDCFIPKCNPAIPPSQLLDEEREFEERVSSLGVYGYVLEVWNPALGVGWDHVDSCSGFVGNYEEGNHYIIEEFKRAAIAGELAVY